MNEVSKQDIFVGKNKKDFPQRCENNLLLRHPKKLLEKQYLYIPRVKVVYISEVKVVEVAQIVM